MTVSEALKKLEAYEKASFALSHASGLIYHDAVTLAPKDSARVRAVSLGELSRMSYELSTADETVKMLETLAAAKDELDAVTRRKVTELYRDYDRTRRIPKDEYVAYQQLVSEADDVWHEAKGKNDFASFEPYLQRIFDTTRRIALYMEPDRDPYETQLDLYERGLTVERCDAFFAALRERLVPLIRRVNEHADRVDDAPLYHPFPLETQRRLSSFVMDVMGLDKNRCILGETEHPFTNDFSKYDVRITTHYYENAFTYSLFSVVHEGGHALYELHTGDEFAFTSLGGGASMGIHESQSRFYENIVGRSRAFCSVLYPWLCENAPAQLDGISEDALYRMINRSQPSLIRTEADELTYCLHIMVRYELEKKMFSGELTAKELPAAWNALYKEYLGIDVPDDTHGVLQDSHWAGGGIGYFPSYAIGSAYGPQYLREMQKTLDVDAIIRSGDLREINRWFEERVWRHGAMLDPTPLFESVCGKFDPTCYTDYLEKKFSEIYSL